MNKSVFPLVLIHPVLYYPLKMNNCRVSSKVLTLLIRNSSRTIAEYAASSFDSG